ncbi:hypothetical protein C882_2283 [Caenispirillum salinarum AK4]|uniref:Helix-turn-helix domain-containing protein n=2 Tax=Caenispirillum TaxID=414051 RepID=K9HCW0_9PROT|nr:hypothetical protein C882_2283 [Caenispirillum salinarum AK4]
MRQLAPLGIESALEAVARCQTAVSERCRHLELALAQARYEADLARRQYDAVDPGNRLVASELERRWNDRLVDVARLEDQLTAQSGEDTGALTEEERAHLMALGRDLDAAWNHPGATTETRKRIVRTAIHEIMVKVEDERINLVIHWAGGDHTRLVVPKNRPGHHRWIGDPETGDLIHRLARQQSDAAIAATLNRIGKRTGRGNTWTEVRVRSYRNAHGIAVFKPGELAERGELTLEEAADRLKVSKMTVLRLISAGTIHGYQACKGGPWAIPAHQLSTLPPQLRSQGRPVTPDPDQIPLKF